MTKELELATRMQDIQTLAEAAAKSGLYSTIKYEGGKQKSAQLSVYEALIKIKLGQEFGFKEAQSLSLIQVINGKPTVAAKGLAAMVKASGKYDYVVNQWNHKVCQVTFFQNGQRDRIKLGISSFTIEDAKKAGLLDGKNKHTWEKYTRNMLFARAISNGVTLYCPHIGAGLYSSEEMHDVALESSSDMMVDAEFEEVPQQKNKAPPPEEQVGFEAFKERFNEKRETPEDDRDKWKAEHDYLKEALEPLDLSIEDLFAIECLLPSDLDSIKSTSTAELHRCSEHVKEWLEEDQKLDSENAFLLIADDLEQSEYLPDLKTRWDGWQTEIKRFSPLFLMRIIKVKDQQKAELVQEKEQADDSSQKSKFETAMAALHAKASELGYGSGDVVHQRIKTMFGVEVSMKDLRLAELTRMRKALEFDGDVHFYMDSIRSFQAVTSENPKELKRKLDEFVTLSKSFPKHVGVLAAFVIQEARQEIRKLESA
jgi:hypothetical protein